MAILELAMAALWPDLSIPAFVGNSRHTLPMASGNLHHARRRGFGPFVTWIEYEESDGLLVHWDSRSQRKHASRDLGSSTWWAPRTRGWWLAILFAAGSVLFAVAAIPGFALVAGVREDSVTFFVGSVLLTVAAYCNIERWWTRHREDLQRVGVGAYPSVSGASTGGQRSFSCWEPSSST